jgi:hypothetical protein
MDCGQQPIGHGSSFDFHPGDTGVAIGSVVQTQGMVVPAAYKSIDRVIATQVAAGMVEVVAKIFQGVKDGCNYSDWLIDR